MTATASATVTMTDPRQSDSRTPERGLYLRLAWRGRRGETFDGAGIVPPVSPLMQSIVVTCEPKSREQSGFEESIDRGWTIHQQDWQSVSAPTHRASHRKGRQPLHPMDPIHLNLHRPFVSWHVEIHLIVIFSNLVQKANSPAPNWVSRVFFEDEGKLRF